METLKLILSVIAAAIPSLSAVYLIRLHSEKGEGPNRLLFMVFVLGVLASAPALLISMVLLLPAYALPAATPSWIAALLTAFLSTGFGYTISQYFMMKAVSWRSDGLEDEKDGVLICEVSWMAFCTTLNLIPMITMLAKPDAITLTDMLRCYAYLSAMPAIAIQMGRKYGKAKEADDQGNKKAARKLQVQSVLAGTCMLGTAEYFVSLGQAYHHAWIGIFGLVIGILWSYLEIKHWNEANARKKK